MVSDSEGVPGDGDLASSMLVAGLGGVSMEECIERADLALYRAKQAGRNLVVVYGEDTSDE